MNGVTFNNKHSYNDLGLWMRSDDRTLLPSLRKREITIDGKDGVWDFGGNSYEKRLISVTFYYPAESRIDLRVKARRIAQWLSNKTASMLIFDDEPDKEYIARIYSEIKPKEIVNDAEFTVVFDCQPIAELIYNADDIILDSSILLDHTDIRLGDEYTYTITQLTQFEINNFGTYEVRPVIEIAGTFSTFKIGINGLVINYNETLTNASITIDCENYTIKKDQAINKLNVVSGNLNTFLELQPGINTVYVDGTNLNCVVSFVFKPKFL